MTLDKCFLVACFGWFVMGGNDAVSVEVQDGWLQVVIKKWTLCATLLDKGGQDEKSMCSHLDPSDSMDTFIMEATASQ